MGELFLILVAAGIVGGTVATAALLSLSYLAHYAARRKAEVKADTADLLSSLERQGQYTTHNPRVTQEADPDDQ